jgi:hypothetical protein
MVHETKEFNKVEISKFLSGVYPQV